MRLAEVTWGYMRLAYVTCGHTWSQKIIKGHIRWPEVT